MPGPYTSELPSLLITISRALSTIIAALILPVSVLEVLASEKQSPPYNSFRNTECTKRIANTYHHVSSYRPLICYSINRHTVTERTKNWSAITPQKPYASWPEYIKNWPGLESSVQIRDGAGNVVPSLKTDVVGIGLWWFWISRVAGPGDGLNLPATNFSELAMAMAGVTAASHPRAQNYLRQYIGSKEKAFDGLASTYFQSPINAATVLNLLDAETRWNVARTVFHHEAGHAVKLPREVFELGVEFAEQVAQNQVVRYVDFSEIIGPSILVSKEVVGTKKKIQKQGSQKFFGRQ